MSHLNRLKNCFVSSLNVKEDQVTDTFSYGQTGWDSVAHMALIAAIEQEFDLMIDTEDVIDMSSFSKAKEIVTKYGINLNAE